MAQFNYPITKLILSHSTSSSYRSCARKLEFRKFFGTTKQELDEWGTPVDNFAADIGKCLHEGFQDYLVNLNEDRAIFKLMLKYPVRAEPRQENNYRSLEATYATLMAMIRSDIVGRYELIQIKTKDGITRPAVEVPYVIEFTGSPMPIPVYHVGLIDAIFYDKIEQRYIVVDIKTHRDNTNDLSLRYEYDEQTVPYGLILEHILGKQVTEFTVGYMSCFIDLMEPRIRLYEFKKSQEHIKDWFIGQCVDIKHIAWYMENQWFPRALNGSTCMAFRKRCGHAEVCSYRDVNVLNRILGTEPRETFFHDGKEPWIMVQIPFMQEIGV